MREEKRSVAGSDGFSIQVWHWTPDEGTAVRGAIQISHGLAEHADRYRRFAKALTAAGYGVMASDHRGHGGSVGPECPLGHFGDEGGWELVVEDLAHVNQALRTAHPGVPVALFSHSMGSTLGVHLLVKYPELFACAILSGPTGAVGLLRKLGALAARGERYRLGKRGKSQILHQLSFGDFNKAFEPTRTDSDWLSRDPVEVDLYVSDPLCGFIASTQHWYDHLEALGIMEDPSALKHLPQELPLLILAGSDDPVSKGTAQLQTLLSNLAKAGKTKVEHYFEPEGRHELLNDTCREAITQRILDWYEAKMF